MSVRLEELTPAVRVAGVVPGRAVTVVAVAWHGTQAVTLTYRDDAGAVAERVLFRDDEKDLSVEAKGPGVVVRRRRPPVPARLGGEAHPARLSLPGQELHRCDYRPDSPRTTELLRRKPAV